MIRHRGRRPQVAVARVPWWGCRRLRFRTPGCRRIQRGRERLRDGGDTGRAKQPDRRVRVRGDPQIGYGDKWLVNGSVQGQGKCEDNALYYVTARSSTGQENEGRHVSNC